jgi:hypothetical protein
MSSSGTIILPKAPISTIEFDAQQLQLTIPITFRKTLFRSDQVIFESYTDHKIYITFVTFDASNAPVNFSSSLYLQ